MGFVAHLICFSILGSIAQGAPDAGHGAFVGASLGRMLEGPANRPLVVTGDHLAIEAGWLIPGGSMFLFEVGGRGLVAGAPASSALQRRIAREASLFGGVRIAFDPIAAIVPLIRAGFGPALIHEQRFPDPLRNPNGPITYADRGTIESYFALGIERELSFGTSIALFADSRAALAPLSAAIGLCLMVQAQAAP